MLFSWLSLDAEPEWGILGLQGEEDVNPPNSLHFAKSCTMLASLGEHTRIGLPESRNLILGYILPRNLPIK